jgi:hypothetical protein
MNLDELAMKRGLKICSTPACVGKATVKIPNHPEALFLCSECKRIYLGQEDEEGADKARG